MEVYSLVSSANRYSPDFTQLPPGHRTCSFISHLNSPGSIQPGCHFRPMKLFKHTSLHCPIRYPLTPGSRECTCKQSALPRSTMSKHIQHSRGPNPRSLACKSRTVPLSHDAPQTFHYLPFCKWEKVECSDAQLQYWCVWQWCHLVNVSELMYVLHYWLLVFSHDTGFNCYRRL